MQNLWWIHVVFGLLAIGSGMLVLRGTLKVALRGARVVRFLRFSLIAALAGLLPFTSHLSLVHEICMLSVYCSGAIVLAWRKFSLAGLWRLAFVLLLVAVLYLNIVSVSLRRFRGLTRVCFPKVTHLACNQACH